MVEAQCEVVLLDSCEVPWRMHGVGKVVDCVSGKESSATGPLSRLVSLIAAGHG
jgi:hypothetical protein